MKKTRNLAVVLTACLTASLALTACGNKRDETGDTGTADSARVTEA
jgi:hypothetical protein